MLAFVEIATYVDKLFQFNLSQYYASNKGEIKKREIRALIKASKLLKCEIY
jgi:hypothetical protein